MSNVVNLTEARRRRPKAELTSTRALLAGVVLPRPAVDPVLLRKRQLLLLRSPYQSRAK